MDRGFHLKLGPGKSSGLAFANELDIIENRLDLARREEAVFANLSSEASEDLSAITLRKSYSNGTELFAHNEVALGVFIVCSGRVNLFISLTKDNILSFGTAGPGDILGLIATFAARPHRTSARTLEASELKFIPRTQFLEFLAKYGDVTLRIIGQLCEAYEQALHAMRAAGLPRTAVGRFARFLLEWPSEQTGEKDEIRIEMPLTHETIAGMIGIRRETLSRILSDFRRLQLMRTEEQTICIRSRAALETIANL